MSVLKDSIAIVREAEKLVIGRTVESSGRLLPELLDALLHVPWFVMSGMKALLILLLRCVVFSVAWAAFLYFTSAVFSDEESTAGLMQAAAILGIGSILFGLPSSLVARSVSEEQVQGLARGIAQLAGGQEYLALLRRSVDEIGAVGISRISAISWMLGLGWAFLVWLGTNLIFTTDVSAEVRNAGISYGLGGIAIFVVVSTVFASYREASRLLRQTVVFAFAEAEQVLRSAGATRYSVAKETDSCS